MAQTNKSSNEHFDSDIYRALDIVRGEFDIATSSLLALSTYGIKVLADPTYPHQEIRQEAERAWEHLLHLESAPASLALARSTARILRRTISGKNPGLFRDHEVLAAEFIAPLFGAYSTNNDGTIPKLIRFAQQLPKFHDDNQRQIFSAALLAATLDSSSRDIRSHGRTEHTSSPVLGEIIATLAKHWVTDPPKTAYDPAIGTGQTLLQAAKALKPDNTSPLATLYGQDINHASLLATSWRLLLNDASNIQLRPGDVLLDPAFLDKGERIQRFDLVTSTPPINLRITRKSDLAKLENDPSNRFQFGPTPRSSADWLFVQHALASTNPGGTAIIGLAPGALFRKGIEGDVRRALITADHISAVLLLPPGLIPGTSIQSALLVLEPRKPDERRGTIQLIDLAANPHENLVAALREELNGHETNKSTTVTINQLREGDYSLLPTPYLPPRDVRSTLMTRQTAQAQLDNAITDLTAAAAQFKTHLESGHQP